MIKKHFSDAEYYELSLRYMKLGNDYIDVVKVAKDLGKLLDESYSKINKLEGVIL